MEAGKQVPHGVVLSVGLQGHLNPILQLSLKLASSGCFITFVVSENNVPGHVAHPNLHFATVPHLPPPQTSSSSLIDSTLLDSSSSSLLDSTLLDSLHSMTSLQPAVRDLLHRLHLHPVSFIISDIFVTWSFALASEFSIPFLAFYTSNATACAIVSHVPRLAATGVLPFPRDDKGKLTATRPVDFVPGVPSLLPEDFPVCVTFDSSHFRYRFAMDRYESLGSATAIIVNTFEELEGTPLAELRKEKPVHAVGPLLLLAGAPSGPDEQDECLDWLGTREPASVLFVSFGSLAALPAAHLKELALGLEASGQPFLWVIRTGTLDASLSESLPDGFLSRTKDRGLIISWAPQILVLSHRSVGGFLTHGGWNSIIENLSTGGVPMICWPLEAEQRLNRRLVVDEWKIGMEFRHREDGMVEKEEVEKVVRCMMRGQEGKDMRRTVQKMRDAAKGAVEDGGSSSRSLDALLESLGLPPKSHPHVSTWDGHDAS